MNNAKTRKKKPTEDTLVYLNDIRGTAELLMAEVEHIDQILEMNAMNSEPEEFELAVDDVASETFKQYLLLQKFAEASFK